MPTPHEVFGGKKNEKVVTEDVTTEKVSDTDKVRDEENDAARKERDDEAKEAEEAVIVGTDGKRYKVSEYNNE